MLFCMNSSCSLFLLNMREFLLGIRCYNPTTKMSGKLSSAAELGSNHLRMLSSIETSGFIPPMFHVQTASLMKSIAEKSS